MHSMQACIVVELACHVNSWRGSLGLRINHTKRQLAGHPAADRTHAKM